MSPNNKLLPALIAIIFCFLTACSAPLGESIGDHSPTLTPFHPLPLTPTNTVTASPEPTQTMMPSQTPTFLSSEEGILVEGGTIICPILLYHHISPKLESKYNVKPEEFEKQIKWLFDNHYSTINISDLAKFLREGGRMPERPVVITFDDGYLEVVKFAYPILEKYGFVATFYVIAEMVDTPGNPTSDQLKGLIHDGWEIGSHSYTHIDLNKEGTDLDREIIDSKSRIEEKVGVPVLSFAYPYGLAKPSVIDQTIKAGYSSAVGLGDYSTQLLSKIYYLSRIDIDANFSMEDFLEILPWSGSLE